MAAETLTSTAAASTAPVFKAHGNVLQVAYGTYEVAANVEDGDIFEMCKVPAGARLLGGQFYCDDLDTGTEALDMDIGWAANGGTGTFDSADPDGLGNLGTLTGDAFAAGNVSPVAGLIYPFSGVFADGDLPYFTRETTLQVEANTAANAFTAGAMSLVVYYVVDESLVDA
jgi:hypothetical protein